MGRVGRLGRTELEDRETEVGRSRGGDHRGETDVEAVIINAIMIGTGGGGKKREREYGQREGESGGKVKSVCSGVAGGGGRGNIRRDGSDDSERSGGVEVHLLVVNEVVDVVEVSDGLEEELEGDGAEHDDLIPHRKRIKITMISVRGV